jgi:hypothetical protein
VVRQYNFQSLKNCWGYQARSKTYGQAFLAPSGWPKMMRRAGVEGKGSQPPCPEFQNWATGTPAKYYIVSTKSPSR